MTPRPMWTVPAACAMGIGIGLAYTLSPFTVWCGVALTLIFFWAARGTTGRERTWILGLLSTAVALRLIAIVVFFLLTYDVEGSFAALIPDEPHIARRSLWLRNLAVGIPISPVDYVEAGNPYGESGFLYLLAYLQMHLGAAPYGTRLLNVALYLGAAVALFRTVRSTFGPRVAIGGFAIVLFLPSLFVWSISSLKEPAYTFLTAVSLSMAAAGLRPGTVRARASALLICIAAVVAMGTVRAGAQVMVGGGILSGLILAGLLRRPALLLLSVAVCTMVGFQALQQPQVQQRAMELMREAAVIHRGHVMTTGWSYKLLDPEFYTRRAPSTQEIVNGMDVDDMGRFAVRAVVSFVVVPLPWRLASPSAVAYLPEQVVWYVLVALAALGLCAGLRNGGALTCMLLGVIITSTLVIAFTSGNVGTLVRHRGMVLILVPWLSSLGASVVVARAASRSRVKRPAPEPPPVFAGV